MARKSRNNGRPARLSVACLKLVQAYLGSCERREAPTPEASKAWEEFFARCDGVMRRFAAGFGLRDHDQDDCIQKVWFKVTTRLPNFICHSNEPHIEAWLYTLVRSVVADQGREKSRHPTLPLTPDIEEHLQAPHPVRPGAEHSGKDRRRAVLRKGIAKLRQRASVLSFRVFEMHWLEGFTYGQIARALKLTRERVWSRDCRMRNKLRELCRQRRSRSD